MRRWSTGWIGRGLLLFSLGACVPPEGAGPNDAGSQAGALSREAMAGELWQTSQCFDRIENKPEYQALLEKSPSVQEGGAAAGYVDNNTVTEAERRELQRFIADIQLCRPAVDRFQGTPLQEYARGILTVWNQQQVLYQQLLSGQVTWGVFNKRSAENTGRLGAVMADLTGQGSAMAGGASGGPQPMGGRGTRTTPIMDVTGQAPGAIRPGASGGAGNASAAGPGGGLAASDAAAAAPGGGPFLVHLASYRSVESARRGWDTLLQRFGPVLGNLRPVTANVSVPGKGEFIRLLAGALPDSAAAGTLCDSLKNRGHGFCQVVGTR